MCYVFLNVIVRVHKSVTIKRYKGATAARARGVLLVKILNNISIHWYIGCLHENKFKYSYLIG